MCDSRRLECARACACDSDPEGMEEETDVRDGKLSYPLVCHHILIRLHLLAVKKCVCIRIWEGV